MSKKYKLKKWYPCLSEEWKVGDTVTKDGDYYYKDKSSILTNAVYKGQVENNPDFWEKVEEEDYKILKLKPNRNHPNYHVGATPSHICKYREGIKMDWFDIYSVERLSDGEVFTVGDKVYWDWTIGPDRGYYTIKSFYFDSRNYLRLDTVEESHQAFDLLYTAFKGEKSLLQRLNHYEEPLFTAEDGVDIYEGDSYFVPQKNTPNTFSGAVRKFSASKTKDYSADDSHRFSTEEEANKLIEEHKPKYSKADIKEAIEHADFSGAFSSAHINLKSFWKKLDNN